MHHEQGHGRCGATPYTACPCSVFTVRLCTPAIVIAPLAGAANRNLTFRLFSIHYAIEMKIETRLKQSVLAGRRCLNRGINLCGLALSLFLLAGLVACESLPEEEQIVEGSEEIEAVEVGVEEVALEEQEVALEEEEVAREEQDALRAAAETAYREAEESIRDTELLQKQLLETYSREFPEAEVSVDDSR